MAEHLWAVFTVKQAWTSVEGVIRPWVGLCAVRQMEPGVGKPDGERPSPCWLWASAALSSVTCQQECSPCLASLETVRAAGNGLCESQANYKAPCMLQRPKPVVNVPVAGLSSLPPAFGGQRQHVTPALLEQGGGVSLLPVSSREPPCAAGRMGFHWERSAFGGDGETRAPSDGLFTE